ncbi:hypothetical protein ACFQU1_05775 [Chelatococcus sp. GCM10030263]|uniref:hypothetical protein n=1 Tax=Chelatococcus sp. GCM10030263 TaxID=3273387 RepID=UPI00360D93F8
MRIISVLALASILGGCASGSSDIRAAYVSPIPYQSYSCRQLGEEAERVSARAAEVAGIQDRKRTDDAVATTVGVIVFWPVLFAIKGDGQTAAELSRLRGEMEAIEKVSVQKNCGISFQKAPAKTS